MYPNRKHCTEHPTESKRYETGFALLNLTDQSFNLILSYRLMAKFLWDFLTGSFEYTTNGKVISALGTESTRLGVFTLYLDLSMWSAFSVKELWTCWLIISGLLVLAKSHAFSMILLLEMSYHSTLIAYISHESMRYFYSVSSVAW